MISLELTTLNHARKASRALTPPSLFDEESNETSLKDASSIAPKAIACPSRLFRQIGHIDRHDQSGASGGCRGADFVGVAASVGYDFEMTLSKPLK